MPDQILKPERRIDLDWIRIFAFGFLILYHVGMLFVPWDFHVKSAHTLPGLEPLMLVLNPWRLSLLFLVSGAATHFMAVTLSARALFASRAVRLVPPILFGMFVVVPPQSYLQVVEQWDYTGSFAEFYKTHYLAFAAQFCKDGRCLILPTWNHLWFVVYLFVYTTALALVLAIAPGLLRSIKSWLTPKLTGPWLLIVPVLVLATDRLLLYPAFPQTDALFGDWYNHALYGSVFLFGYLFAPDGRIVATTLRLRWPALLGAVVCYVTFMTCRAIAMNGASFTTALTFIGGFAYAGFQWTCILAILGFGRQWLTRDTPARRYLTEAVFPFYIVHQTVMIVADHELRAFDLPAWGEASLAIAATVAVCIFSYEVARRVAWLRPLFGLKLLRSQPLAGDGQQR